MSKWQGLKAPAVSNSTGCAERKKISHGLRWLEQEVNLEVNVAGVAALAVGGRVSAHVQALAQPCVVYLLPAMRHICVRTSPHQQPLLRDWHKVATARWQLRLCNSHTYSVNIWLFSLMQCLILTECFRPVLSQEVRYNQPFKAFECTAMHVHLLCSSHVRF